MSTPPPSSSDFPGQVVPFDPYWAPTEPEVRPPSPPTGPPRPPTPRLIQQPPRLALKAPDSAEVRTLEHAITAGSLQDVHQILAQYILTRTPDPTTGRLSLSLFHRSVTVAIANNNAAILSYLFFMRIGEPSAYLYCAIQAESCAIFQVLLRYGWNINQPLERTKPPALGYVSHNKELINWFLDHGADPNTSCAWDITPMSMAMYHAPLDAIKMLFERGGDIKYGQLLHNAVLREGADTIELVCLLLDMGAPINQVQYQNHPQSYRDNYPFPLGTPLHYAAEEGKADLVSCLLQRGGDPLIKNTKGRTVLEQAELLQKLEVVHVLRRGLL